MRSPTSRSGATLPMVMLLITVMTIALAAAYTLNGTESQVGDDYEEQLDAFGLAESGRHRFLANAAAFTAPPDSLVIDSIAYTGGSARVTLRRIRPQVQQLPPLYLLTSTGVRTGATRGNIPRASRTVAQYLFWDAAPLNVLAGWTSLSGLTKNGTNPGSISGVDANPGTADCPPALNMVAGVAVPTAPGFGGDPLNLAGTPLIKDLGNPAATQGAVDIDWPGIYDMTADIVYDIIIPGGTWPTAAQFADPNFWPTIRINGDYTINTYGKGTLIVTGNLVMSSVSAKWDGVVLVGGTMTSNGNTGVNGATVTGLNILRGVAVPVSDVGNGTKSYKYNSCNAAKALKSQAKLRPLPNTWMDNYASY